MDFTAAAEPFRAELLAYCYRLLGSVHVAEDAVQEAYLRAWLAYDRFADPAAVRRRLYSVATGACLAVIEQRARPLPLEPLPAALVSGAGIRLAFLAGLRHLPPRQRAVLVLRDVLQWPAAEVAQMFAMTSTAVNSALQRAHATLRALDLDLTEAAEPEDPALVDLYAAAFASADPARLAGLLHDDVLLDLPPHVHRGRDAVVDRLAGQAPGPAGRLVATRANGQAAVECHLPEGLHAVHVLTLRGERIARITALTAG